MECAYYLKAVFPTEKDAKEAVEKLNLFFTEVREFRNLYEKPTKISWATIEKKYPRASEYIKHIGLWGKKTPNLNEYLDFGSDDTNEVSIEGNEIAWVDGNVWHFADWTKLCSFIERKYGATKAVWASEESGCGSLDSLNLYDWEDIVKALLENKELWPLLLNVHPDLTQLLEARMKKQKE